MRSASPLLPALALFLSASSAAAAELRKLDQANRLITVRWEASPGQKLLDAAFDVELRDPSRPDAAGGRSMTGAALLDCPGGLARLTRLVIHAEPGLKGAELRRFAPQTAWVRPEPTSLLSAVIQGACGTSAPSRPRPAAVASAPAKPVPSSSKAVIVADQPASPAAPGPPPNERPGGDFRIQVGSFPIRADAETRAAALRAGAPGLPAARIETARVRAATYHRVLIDGFASAGAAEAACRELRAAGTPCLVKSAVRR